LLKRYFHKNFWGPVKVFLKKGLTPKKLALTLALGIIIGLFPIVGTTTILCFIVAVLLRLNIAVIQLVNYFVYPLQLILFIPMIKLGSYFFSESQIPDLSFFLEHKWIAIKIFWVNVLFGVGVWIILAIPLFFIIYYLAYKAFKKELA